ncbi:hypothetical protein GCM10020370_00260 [Paenibacillus hodogayensis]
MVATTELLSALLKVSFMKSMQAVPAKAEARNNVIIINAFLLILNISSLPPMSLGVMNFQRIRQKLLCYASVSRTENHAQILFGFRPEHIVR